MNYLELKTYGFGDGLQVVGEETNKLLTTFVDKSATATMAVSAKTYANRTVSKGQGGRGKGGKGKGGKGGKGDIPSYPLSSE